MQNKLVLLITSLVIASFLIVGWLSMKELSWFGETMEEFSASAESLSRLAEELNALVGRFKV